MLVKYFTKVGEQWQIAPEIRDMVTFRHSNLLHDFSNFGLFDVVFCRNVLIYFEPAMKSSVLNRLPGRSQATAICCSGPPKQWWGCRTPSVR